MADKRKIDGKTRQAVRRKDGKIWQKNWPQRKRHLKASLSLSRKPLYQMRKKGENDVTSGTLDDC
jgi:hypothetical protein